MKKLTQLAFSAIFLFSCEKENLIFDSYNGNVQGIKNNSNWKAKTRCFHNEEENTIDLYFGRFNEYKELIEHFYIENIPAKIGENKLNEKNWNQTVDSLVTVRYSTLIGGDAGSSNYKLDEGIFPNNITLTKIQGTEIWGEFQGQFVKDGTGDPMDPEKVTFKDVTFYAKISE